VKLRRIPSDEYKLFRFTLFPINSFTIHRILPVALTYHLVKCLLIIYWSENDRRLGADGSRSFLKARVGVRQGEDVGDGAVCELIVTMHHEFGPAWWTSAIEYLLSLLLPPETKDKSAPSLVNHKNVSGNTPLHWAALNGHLSCVKALMAVMRPWIAPCRTSWTAPPSYLEESLLLPCIHPLFPPLED
jgi:Ankyrin repeats (many copies)